MTNPGNAIGTNGAYGGRTSVNASNDVLAAFSGPGILAGWQCVPKSGLTVALGGNGVVRDVAIAEDDTGNRTTVDNISEQPVDVTLTTAPNLGQRIDSIVAYVNNPPEGTTTDADNPGACGLIVVAGEVVATNPVAPTESDIRTAIGADGGVSTTAYYVVLAKVLVTEGMTDVVASNITMGDPIGVGITDKELNPLSDNPIANSAVTKEIQDIQTEINGADSTLTRIDSGAGVNLS